MREGPVQKLPVRDCKYRVARLIFDLNSQMRDVYLSLDQGWIQYEERYTPLSAARERIRANADKLQSLLSSRLGDFSISPILLDSANTLGRGHWLGELLPSMIRALQTDLETIERAITANVRVRQSVLKVSRESRELRRAVYNLGEALSALNDEIVISQSDVAKLLSMAREQLSRGTSAN